MTEELPSLCSNQGKITLKKKTTKKKKNDVPFGFNVS